MEKGQKITVKDRYWKVTIVHRDVSGGTLEDLEETVRTDVSGLFFDVLKNTVDNDN